MTDLITSTFAQLCCFCFPCGREKQNRADDEETDAEALEKAQQWRQRMANAEHGGKPPGYQPPMEMNQENGARESYIGPGHGGPELPGAGSAGGARQSHERRPGS